MFYASITVLRHITNQTGHVTELKLPFSQLLWCVPAFRWSFPWTQFKIQRNFTTNRWTVNEWNVSGRKTVALYFNQDIHTKQLLSSRYTNKSCPRELSNIIILQYQTPFSKDELQSSSRTLFGTLLGPFIVSLKLCTMTLNATPWLITHYLSFQILRKPNSISTQHSVHYESHRLEHNYVTRCYFG